MSALLRQSILADAHTRYLVVPKLPRTERDLEHRTDLVSHFHLPIGSQWQLAVNLLDHLPRARVAYVPCCPSLWQVDSFDVINPRLIMHT